jgi:hypothetical protein
MWESHMSEPSPESSPELSQAAQEPTSSVAPLSSEARLLERVLAEPVLGAELGEAGEPLELPAQLGWVARLLLVVRDQLRVGSVLGLGLAVLLALQIYGLKNALISAAEKQVRDEERSQGRSRIAQPQGGDGSRKPGMRPRGGVHSLAGIDVGSASGRQPPAPGAPIGFQLGRPGQSRGIRPVEFRDIVGVMSLLEDVKQPLDNKQREKVAEIARQYFETSKSSISATAKVFLVLTDEQRRDVMRPRTGIDFNLPPVPPGKSPLVEYLASVLEKQAGSTPAEPQTATETTSVCTDRFTVLRGLGYLATQKALSPEQARSGLEFVYELRAVFAKQADLDVRLNKVFTQEQQLLLSQKVIPRNEDATAWLVCRYLERK